MSKKILVLEDDNKVFNMILPVLSQYGTVEQVRAVDEAIGSFNENGDFDLVIVDLKIIAEGLSSEQMVNYCDMEGLAFLIEYYLKAKDEKESEDLAKKIIICSRYTANLERKFPEQSKWFMKVQKGDGFVGRLDSMVRKLFQ